MKTGIHILLINYDFPPNEGIGGRRWAKISKQLALDGYIVHVIKADPIQNQTHSFWIDDVTHSNIHVHSLPRKYPVNFSHPGHGIYSRILYQIQKRLLLIREKGTIYDISIGWRKQLLKKAIELISQNNIVNIIASGAPWKMLYDVACLKEKLPELNLIVDYRDPWLTAINYGMQNLTTARRKEEERKQTFVLNAASVVTSPYEHLTAELQKWANSHCVNKPIFDVFTHFFDPSDIVETEKPTKTDITFIYGGDFYQGIEKELEFLKKELAFLKENNFQLYSSVAFRFYTKDSKKDIFKDFENVTILPPIGKNLFKEIANASCVMIILPYHKRNDKTTKFFENLLYRKPYLVLADPGEVTQFVKENKLGFVVNTEEGSMSEIIKMFKNRTIEFNSQFDVSPYSLKAVTNKLTAYFK